MINGLGAALQELLSGVGKNRRGNILIHQKFTSVEQKLEGIDNAIEGEVIKGIRAVLQNIDAMTREGPMFDATLSRKHIKGESSPNLPPCLDLGKDNRRFGGRDQNRTTARDEKEPKDGT